MKRLLALSLLGSSLLIGSNPAIADWDTWAAKTPIQSWESDASYVELYTVDSSTGNSTLRTTYGKTRSSCK